EDFRRDIPLSDEILGQVVRSYRTLRNTIRFQLGTLDDFSWGENRVEISEMDMIDRWALAQSAELVDEVTKAFEAYEFHKVVQLINRYCSGVLSSTYHDIIKDRLYTLHPNDHKRRSTQTGVQLIFETLVRLLGPIMPFTADEAWSFHKSGKSCGGDLLCLEDWPTFDDEWLGDELVKDAELLLELKESKINEVLENLRAQKKIGQSLDAEVEIEVARDDPLFEPIKRRAELLPELFIVSGVQIIELDQGNPLSVSARHAGGVRCPRSWRWVPKLVAVEPWGEVSPRCAEVLAKL
ncbi:MAG: class I tRNA ligase family protein, partial [Verrucomicrobiota bacterium]|nr:class I tRNA ligase family protein [Verrucomicrobiota bacterium]